MKVNRTIQNYDDIATAGTFDVLLVKEKEGKITKLKETIGLGKYVLKRQSKKY